MKVHWLIDADMFAAYRDDLVAAIRAQGNDVKQIHAPRPPYRWDDAGCSYRDTFPKEACVIALGDIELVTRIHHERRWSPGAFCTVENFACSSYYCHFGSYLLNQDYVMLPFGELARRKEFLFDTFGRDDGIFVRPDSPLKLFTGQVASRNTFDADLEFMAFYEFPVSSLVLVSSPKRITAEWRFVIADQKVVTGCLYKSENGLEPQPIVETSAYGLAAQIASHEYQPDPVWIVDICMTDDNSLHLLEIGGFSFADLYTCDKAAIVKAVSQAAILEWERAHSGSLRAEE